MEELKLAKKKFCTFLHISNTDGNVFVTCCCLILCFFSTINGLKQPTTAIGHLFIYFMFCFLYYKETIHHHLPLTVKRKDSIYIYI